MKGVNVVNGNKYESFVGYPSTKKDFVLQWKIGEKWNGNNYQNKMK
jgi:hypothetical protein